MPDLLGGIEDKLVDLFANFGNKFHHLACLANVQSRIFSGFELSRDY